MAKNSTSVAGPNEPASSTTKAANAKWNDDAHQAMCATLLEVVESAGASWRSHLYHMIELSEYCLRGNIFRIYILLEF